MWKEIKKKTEKYGWILALFGIIPDVWFFYELFEKIKHNMNKTYLLGISGTLSGLSIMALIFWLWHKIEKGLEKRKPKGTCLLLPPNDKFEALVLGINEKIKYLIEDFAISHRSSFKHIESQGHNIYTNSVGYYMRADNEPDKTIKDIQKMVYDHNYFEKTPYIDCINELDKPYNSILKIIDKYKDKIATESEIPIIDSEKLRALLSEITPYRFVIIKDNTIKQRERKNGDIKKTEEQSVKPTGKKWPQTNFFTIDNLCWKAEIFENKKFDLDPIPFCSKCGKKLLNTKNVSESNFYPCPGNFDGTKCENVLLFKDYLFQKELAISKIETEIRNKFL